MVKLVLALIFLPCLGFGDARLGTDFLSEIQQDYGDIMAADASQYAQLMAENNPRLREFRKQMLALTLTSMAETGAFPAGYQPPAGFYSPMTQQMFLELLAVGLNSPQMPNRCNMVRKSIQLLALTTPPSMEATLGFDFEEAVLLISLAHFGYNLARDVGQVPDNIKLKGDNSFSDELMRTAYNLRTPALPCVDMQNRDKEVINSLDYLLRRFGYDGPLSYNSQFYSAPDALFIKSKFLIWESYDVGSKGLYHFQNFKGNLQFPNVMIVKDPKYADQPVPSWSYYLSDINPETNSVSRSSVSIISQAVQRWQSIFGGTP